VHSRDYKQRYGPNNFCAYISISTFLIASNVVPALPLQLMFNFLPSKLTS